MCDRNKTNWGHNVVENGRNWNFIRLLTGHGERWTKHRLTAINFTMKEDHVLVVLKKESPKGPMVAFVQATDLDAALYVVAASIKAKNLGWKPDRFRSMRNDKT